MSEVRECPKCGLLISTTQGVGFVCRFGAGCAVLPTMTVSIDPDRAWIKIIAHQIKAALVARDGIFATITDDELEDAARAALNVVRRAVRPFPVPAEFPSPKAGT